MIISIFSAFPVMLNIYLLCATKTTKTGFDILLYFFLFVQNSRIFITRTLQ